MNQTRSRPTTPFWHSMSMTRLDPLEEFLDLCKEVCTRMEREGSWPWANSPDSQNLVESEDNPKDI